MSAQGQGDTHSASIGLSSVSSEKHIQHLRGSGAKWPVEEPAVARSEVFGEDPLGDWILGEDVEVGVPTRRV